MVGANSSRPGRHTARPGGNRPRTHPSRTPAPSAHSGARKVPSVRPSPTPGRKPVRSEARRMPPAIEHAIDDQREAIEIAMSLLYCLHSALRREVDDVGTLESEAVELASKSADLTDISAMLLVRLDSIHAALDPSELEQVKVHPERLRISELAREVFENDDGEPS